ncbi:hypothetical protein P152DRAFT_495611 [Eremomyces bilateralis CBS 781.70]|uniref:Zn(2)-C6 fungal-type domain-containing protein n=1 Tax=Eremomyces bilateralis CBS 781.70 TaxID=1392243 RepID=A0A6G1GC05_9PEZI|nr:uncharacterized protein P152DRAFT_495611 [Eremomyces bilateralis CBS 781.70]KAF1815431.1 hypothetical protein P152DRAFT_495611 [Eremomyces bilateralis CBS 781.70]
MKACLRCRQQRVRCETDPEDPGGQCLTCRNVSNNSKQTIHHIPCLRYKVTECILYRAGKLGYTSRWQDMKVREITDWESADTQTLVLRNTQELVKDGFQVVLRPFRAQAGDKLFRSWFDQERGVVKSYSLPAWAVENMHVVKEDFKIYTDKHAFDCITHRLQHSDNLIVRTYNRAKIHLRNAPKTEKERVLMTNLLRLWFVSQHTLGSDYFENPQALGLEPHQDPSYPHPGKVPTPPVVNAQFDVIFTEALLKPYKKKVLEELQNIIKDNRPETFITFYLCTFILLHNFSLLIADRYRHARKHGVQSRYTLPDLVSSWHHSAMVILAHYHYCNGSMDPLALDLKNRHRTRLATLNAEEAEFLLQTRDLVKAREDDFAYIRDNDLADHEFYYVSQMFEKDWKPRDTVID